MASDKPAILQETHFVVQEGWAYRFLRGASIQLNKLMFSSAILLIIWLAVAATTDVSGCVDTPNVIEKDSAVLANETAAWRAGVENGTADPSSPPSPYADDGTKATCSIWLSPTSTYLSAMAIISFLLSITLGLLGLVVGKKILESTPAAEEFGAQRPQDATGEGGAAPAAAPDADEDRS